MYTFTCIYLYLFGGYATYAYELHVIDCEVKYSPFDIMYKVKHACMYIGTHTYEYKHTH